MEGLFNLLSGEGEADYSALSRADMIDYGLQQWLYSPIWGYGLDSFKYFYGLVTGVVSYSHNNYVELLFDLGLIGCILYYIFYLKILIKGLTLRNRLPSYARAFSVAVIVSFLIYEFGAVTYSSTPAILMIYMASMLQKLENFEVAEGVNSYE